MKREIINKLTKSFEEAAHVEQGIEYWMARDIQELLEYNEWRNFLNVINKAKFERIRSKGDQALFGGFTTIQMKRKLGIPESRPLADFLPTITIKAKDFAGEITHFNVKKEGLLGEQQITDEHVKNNQDVRNLLAKSNILPENLPTEEDIKKLERRINNENKKFFLSSEILPSN